MRNFKTIIFSISSVFIILFNALVCNAQIKPKSLRISVLNEAITMPTYKVVQFPIHPGLLVGVDLWEKQGVNWDQSFGTDLSYYYHRTYEHAIMIDGSYTLAYKFKFGLQAKLLTNIGYKHSILAGDVYKFENGKYEKAIHWGKAQLNAKLGIGLEYPLSNKYSISADYKFMLALPYTPEKEMPFALHSVFGLGLKINLSQL